MPTLPTKDSLGGLPSLRSGRTYASAADAKEDVSGQEATSLALAKGFQTMAGTVEKIAGQEVQQQDALDLIKANAAHAERLRELDRSFDTDPDWRTYRPRYAEASTQAAADAGAGIRNHSLRARWVEQANERNSAGLHRVLGRGTRLEREEKELEVDGVLERYRKLYAEAPDDETRSHILNEMGVTVTAAQRTGLLDMSRGEAKRRKAFDDVLREDAERRLLAGDSVGLMRDLGALPDPNRKSTVKRFKPAVQLAIDNAAAEVGVDPGLLATFIRIESDGDPNRVTGRYKGLVQLSEEQFRKAGGQGSVFDPIANAKAAAIIIKSETEYFERKYGRQPTAAEIYMIRQQGVGGADAHWRNPDQPAWKSMASTAEGRQKGERWAKQAIWGNVPDDMKAQFGSVDNITSGQFTAMWAEKVERFGGGGGMGPPSQRYAAMSFASRHALVTRSKQAMSYETQHYLEEAYEHLRETGELKKFDDGTTALDRARMFLQPNQVKRAELKLEEARLMHEAVTPLRTMTEQEAVDHIRRYQDPTATGDRAATMRKVSRATEAAWMEISQERASDPAEAVDPYKNVRTNKAGRTRRADEVSGAYDLIKRRYPGVTLRETASGAYEIVDPENASPEAMAETHRARKALIDARIEAQARLGIPRHNRQPISRREATELLDMPENVNTMTPAEYRDRLLAAADRAEVKYGEQMGPIVLESALSMRRPGDADHKDIAARMMAKLARGEALTNTDVRRLNDLRDLNRRQSVFFRPWADAGEPPERSGRSVMPMSRPMMDEPEPAPAPGPATSSAPARPRAAPQPAAREAEPRATRGTGTPDTSPRLPEKSAPSQPARRTQSGYWKRQPQSNVFDADDD